MAEPGSGGTVIEACLSFLSEVTGVVAATGATKGTGGVGLEAAGGSSALAVTVGAVDAVTVGATAVDAAAGADAGGGAEELADGAAFALAWPALAGLELVGGSEGAGACREIAPVTESSPCSRTATRA